jgi:DNA-binding CsgD family transcriptional regulator/tetratricopeptide (TPR) repeat protein
VRLLERDLELGTLGAFWAEARASHGRLVFLGGEAGAGKTSLVSHFCETSTGRARVLVGACDPGATPRPLGPLVDVADALGVRTELDDPDVRRSSLYPTVRSALGRSPTLLLLEDVHWADEATMDLLRYLGRRMDGVPVLAVATFRDDEVAGTHPLAAVMGDLATAAGVDRMQLPLLSEEAVAGLAAESGREVDVGALHRRTAGNPFFVTEVLASDTGALPATVRDAVVARVRRLSAAARRVLEAAAVVGATADIGVLIDVSGESAAAVDECVEAGTLAGAGSSVAFRHDLTREAVLDSTPPAARLDLHRRVLARLEAGGSTDPGQLAHHAVASSDTAAVVRYAPLAADQASRLGSHREAAEHLRTALQHGESLDRTIRADLLERLSYESYLTSEPVEAFATRLEAVTLHETAGDTRRVGAGQRWLSRLAWFLGRSDDAEQYAVAAVATLEPLGRSTDLAMAYSNVSHLRMMSGTPEEALAWGQRAFDEARATGDRAIEAHALNNMGTALLRRGELVEGRSRLDQSLDISLADGLEEHAARAYVNIGALQLVKRELADAERTFRTGMAYCAERDLDSTVLYIQAWLAGVMLERGSVDPAVRLAGGVLRRPNLSVVSRISALLPVGLAAVRRGDPEAEQLLAEVHGLAQDTAEPQRLLPEALLQAEAAWTAGRTDEIAALTEVVWTSFAGAWEPWILAELAWWRTLGGAKDHISFELPAPFALMRAGRVRAASDAWTTIGRPFWAALALSSGGPADTSEAVATLLRLGATASAQAVRRDLAQRGVPVPRGPRSTGRSNPAGLTARELEVLGFLVEGLSDADIATRLTLSERTVGHHVSAILRKLGVPSRSRAAAAAGPILSTPGPT